MAITFNEKWDEVEAQFPTENFAENTTVRPTITVQYFAYSDTEVDEVAIFNAAFSALPSQRGGTNRSAINVKGRKCDLQPDSFEIWDVEVVYGGAGIQEDPDNIEQPYTISIKSAGNSTKTARESLGLVEETQALLDTTWWLEGSDIEDAVGLVPSAADSGSLFSIEGVDVSVGTVEISVQTIRRAVDFPLLVQYSEYASKNIVNATAWNGFPAGTLRMTGFQAGERGGEYKVGEPKPPWEVNFTFLYERNIPTSQIPIGKLQPFDLQVKKGHQLLDIAYVPCEVMVGSALDIPVVVNKPVRAAIHDMFEEVDFKTGLHMTSKPGTNPSPSASPSP